jgi:hypothetical protein
MATTSGQSLVTTIPEAPIKVGVRLAIENLQSTFTTWEFVTCPDGQGGLWVEAKEVALGSPYAQEATFLAFLLPFGLPGVDIYPMFVRPDLSRLDGGALGPVFQITAMSWPGEAEPRPVTQVSRITKGDFAAQTAAQKVTKVIGWMKTQ